MFWGSEFGITVGSSAEGSFDGHQRLGAVATKDGGAR
jgi:hypothetical protein